MDLTDHVRVFLSLLLPGTTVKAKMNLGHTDCLTRTMSSEISAGAKTRCTLILPFDSGIFAGWEQFASDSPRYSLKTVTATLSTLQALSPNDELMTRIVAQAVLSFENRLLGNAKVGFYIHPDADVGCVHSFISSCENRFESVPPEKLDKFWSNFWKYICVPRLVDQLDRCDFREAYNKSKNRVEGYSQLHMYLVNTRKPSFAAFRAQRGRSRRRRSRSGTSRGER
jgi:hypothetical protein